MKFRAFDKVTGEMSSPFSVGTVPIFSGDVNRNDLIMMACLGFTDNKGRDVFQGDVVEVAYQDRSSHLFERMKKLGHDHMYLFFDVDLPYYVLAYRSHDERVNYYYTGCDAGDNLSFLKYIFDYCKAAHVIGNIHEQPELLKLIQTGE